MARADPPTGPPGDTAVSETDDLPTAEPGAEPRRSTRRIAVLAVVAGALAGLAGVYGIGGFDGNASDAGKCRAATARAARLKPYAVADVAAFAPAERPRDLSALAFVGPDGAPRRLADWRGRTVLVNLWATWCVPCRKEMPALDRLQTMRGGADFEVVAIDLDTRAPEAARAFLAEIGVRGLAFHADPSLALFRTLQRQGLAQGLPTTLLIDTEGCTLGAMAGPAEWDGARARALIDEAVRN
jgi:thiol-disulfide isomerase/thioredoxin